MTDGHNLTAYADSSPGRKTGSRRRSKSANPPMSSRCVGGPRATPAVFLAASWQGDDGGRTDFSSLPPASLAKSSFLSPMSIEPVEKGSWRG